MTLKYFVDSRVKWRYLSKERYFFSGICVEFSAYLDSRKALPSAAPTGEGGDDEDKAQEGEEAHVAGDHQGAHRCLFCNSCLAYII